MNLEEALADLIWEISGARKLLFGGDENAEVPDGNSERLPDSEVDLGEHRKHSERWADRSFDLEVQQVGGDRR